MKDILFLEYRIFELVQMNEFLNHQIAHNAVFVFVEDDLIIVGKLLTEAPKGKKAVWHTCLEKCSLIWLQRK